MKTLLNLALVLGCALAIGACESSSNGSSRDVMDMTWRDGGGRRAAYRRSRDRLDGARVQMSNYDRSYYEERVRTRDAQGRPVRPVDQIQFLDQVRPNVSSTQVTKAGVKGKASGDGAATFIDSDGNSVSLDDYAGKTLVLVFTRGFPGYICPMCTTYTAQITERYEEFVAAGAELLLVFPGETRQVDDFILAAREIADSDEPLPFPVLLDPELKAVKSFDIDGDLALPATFVFDGRGKMHWGYVGEKPHERPSVQLILDEVKAVQGM